MTSAAHPYSTSFLNALRKAFVLPVRALPGWLRLPVARLLTARLNQIPGNRITSGADVFDLFTAINRTSEQVKIICDVGAHFGGWTKQFHLYYPSATIYSFEPNGDTYARLQTELLRDPFKQAMTSGQIQLMNCGLYSVGAEADFYMLEHSDSSTLIRPTAELLSLAPELFSTRRVVKVPLITLDSFCEEGHIDGISILKIDVEGAFLDVLKGSKRILQNTDVVFVELDFMYKGHDSRDWIEAADLLYESGLRVSSIRAIGNGCETVTLPGLLDMAWSHEPLPPAQTFAVECIFTRTA
jgi:FkbM family methyltransferase